MGLTKKNLSHKNADSNSNSCKLIDIKSSLWFSQYMNRDAPHVGMHYMQGCFK